MAGASDSLILLSSLDELLFFDAPSAELRLPFAANMFKQMFTSVKNNAKLLASVIPINIQNPEALWAAHLATQVALELHSFVLQSCALSHQP